MEGLPFGLRFTVGDVLELLASGLSEEEILDEHPVLEKRILRRLCFMLPISLKRQSPSMQSDWEIWLDDDNKC